MLKLIATAAVVGGIPGVLTSGLITGVLFHPFQGATPATWRPHEGPARYAGAALTKILLAFIVALLVAVTGGVHAFGLSSPEAAGAMLGILCWAAGAVPVLLSMGLFVNLHVGVVVGLLLDWLVVALIAGTVAGHLVVH